MSIFTTFAKQSMINRLSNPINRNRSAAKISKVMRTSAQAHDTNDLDQLNNQAYLIRFGHTKALLLKKRTLNGHFSLPAETDPYEHIGIDATV